MLALTRKKGESIMVGDNVELIVLGVQGEQVKLGLIAPKSISIHRKEIFEQIKAENREAANLTNISNVSNVSNANFAAIKGLKLKDKHKKRGD
jgi:carbon storage regulator